MKTSDEQLFASENHFKNNIVLCLLIFYILIWLSSFVDDVVMFFALSNSFAESLYTAFMVHIICNMVAVLIFSLKCSCRRQAVSINSASIWWAESLSTCLPYVFSLIGCLLLRVPYWVLTWLLYWLRYVHWWNPHNLIWQAVQRRWQDRGLAARLVWTTTWWCLLLVQSSWFPNPLLLKSSSK